MPVAVSLDVLTIAEFAPALVAHFGSEQAFSVGPPPAAPGVYAWSSGQPVLYVGSAVSLAKRLGNYQRWIAGYDPDSSWEVTVVHMLKVHQASVQWITTSSHEEALELERRLIEWHRACVGMAPPVVGWEAKRESKRAVAENWARDLWWQIYGR
jgi:hypothetical protein